MGLSGPASASQFVDTLVGQTRTHSTVTCAKVQTLGLRRGAISHRLSTCSPPQPSGGGQHREESARVQPTSNPGLVVWSGHSGIGKTEDPITEQQP